MSDTTRFLLESGLFRQIYHIKSGLISINASFVIKAKDHKIFSQLLTN